MSNQAQYLTPVAAAVGALCGAYCAYKAFKLYRETRIPTEWTHVGTLSDLIVYPIKSCGSIRLESAEVTSLGLKDGWLRDRVLMVVDEKNNFITARVYADLLKVQPSVRNSILSLQHVDLDTLYVNLAEVIALGKPETCQVWGVPVPVYDCGKEASDWFSKLLNKPNTFRLVHYASQNSRALRDSAKGGYYKFTKNDTGALPDEVPYNLINQASVDDLNFRLQDCVVSHRNFRPNFLLTGAKPYDEDNWKYVKIGDHVFEIIKPCTRCILTTIDPETGLRNTNSEPVETLKSYRQLWEPAARRSTGNSPRMGIQMALRSAPQGTIALNAPVYVA